LQLLFVALSLIVDERGVRRGREDLRDSRRGDQSKSGRSRDQR
jgi:hypothetical protein